MSDEPAPIEGDTEPLHIQKPPVPPPPFGGRPAADQPASPGVKPPLPERVPEVDAGATQVAPSAYIPAADRRPTQPSNAQDRSPQQPGSYLTGATPPSGYTQRPPVRPAPAPKPLARPPSRPTKESKPLGCILRMLFLSVFTLVLVALCGVSLLFYQYYRIAAQLPDITDLREKASQFETTRILDRNGNVLYEILDPNAGRRTYVPLSKISPFLVAATIATEDKDYYNHPGFNLWAIFRAFYQNLQSGETVSGASTITQQLAKALLFSPEERVEVSYDRKIREAILAAEMTRRYTKDQILELYLNEINYGNLAYGVQAAAETYFGTSAGQLTLGQAAFLAGLPQAPFIYNVYSNPEATFGRMEDVLVLMYRTSQEQNCIYVSNSPDRVCLDPVKVTQAAEEIKNHQFKSPDITIRYPHWVNYVRALLEAKYEPQMIYRSGFSVYTTLDPALQDLAQQAISEQVASLKAQKAGSGALIAIKPSTGEILAMVGSADFYSEEISGQVNMAINPRQPGSSIKPLTYLAAFEKGWTPATLLWDVPSEFPPSGVAGDTRPPYVPVNYDGQFHGPVTVRTALANSYNIPAVKVLEFVGIYDDPNTPQEDGLVAFARRMGIGTLTRPDYGLSLTLGGGDVTLLDLTSAYATMANYGKRMPPVAITKILDYDGDVVFEYQSPAGEQVIRAEHAFLMSSILSDNQARTPAFGSDSVLRLSFPAAVKTGTTNDYRDNWTIGYTPDLAVGVWVGNADYSPMQNTTGMSGAAPIWSKVLQEGIQKLTGGNPTPFNRPPGVSEQVICEISGTSPSQWCPKQRSELFAADQPPLTKEQDLWQKVVIDTWTGYLASPACAEFTDEKFVLNVTDSWARKWIKKDPRGIAWAEKIGFQSPVTFAPERECRADDPRPVLSFLAPRDFETISVNPIDIYAMADATQWFEGMRLDWGFGNEPIEWYPIVQRGHRTSQPDLIARWDAENMPPGLITLRMTLFSSEGTTAEKFLRLNLSIPTPTPTPTPTSTPIPTPTSTPWPTDTPWPTNTPSTSETPVILPPGAETPTPTTTPTPTETPWFWWPWP